MHVIHFSFDSLKRNIDSLPYTYFSSFAATLWLLSPPCQPYTRTGLQKGCADERAKSFLHIMDALESMERENMPEFLLVENVRGFEVCGIRLLLQVMKSECNIGVLATVSIA